MTTEQHQALSHWSMFAIDGFPVRKVGNAKWIITPEGFNTAVCASIPTVFKTKHEACDFWNNLVLLRVREWREVTA